MSTKRLAYLTAAEQVMGPKLVIQHLKAELKDTEKSRKGWMDKCHMEQNHVGSLQTRLHEMQEASKREREDNENMAKLIKRMWMIMDILMSVINLSRRT